MSENYRSVEFAFQFVQPAYDWALRRSDLLESRLQDLLTFMTAITVGAPAFARLVSPNIQLVSGWSFLSVVLYVVAVAVVVWGRAQGTLKVVDPKALFDEWLDLPTETFQVEALRYAGTHLRHNDKTNQRRHYALLAGSSLFAAETVGLFGWLLTA